MGEPRQAKWYVKNGRTILGPLTSPEMRRLAEAGVITANSWVGKGKGNRWAPASTMKGLFCKAADIPDGEDAVPDGDSEPDSLPLESAQPAVAGDDDDSTCAMRSERARVQKAKWYVKKGRKTVGPLTSPQLRELAEKGIITADSLVGKGKGNRWTPASTVTGLFRKAEAAPEGEDAVPDGESERDLRLLEDGEDAVPDGAPEPGTPPLESAGPAVAGDKDDWAYEDDWPYAVDAEPPPLPSSGATTLSSTSEADDPSLPWGYRRTVEDDRRQRRRRWKWLPNFSVSLLGMTINQDTLVVWGLVAGLLVLTAATCAFVSWCPRTSQRVLEARAVTLVHALPTATLVRDNSDGDTLLVKLRLSKRFLRENMGSPDEISAGKDMASVSQSDCHLVSDDADTTARGFLDMEARGSPWETPLDPDSPYHIESSLPQLGSSKADVRGSVKHGVSSGASAAEGSVTASVSGDLKGQVTVGPITHNLSVTGLRATRGVDGFAIEGRVEGKLPDNTPISFDYTGDSCKMTWSGQWLGFGDGGGSFQASLAERWYDKTVDVYCVFSRPRSTSNLFVRYKDASPISLSPSLAGPPK